MGIEHDGFFRKLFFCLMMIDNNQIDSLTRKNLCLLEGVRATIQSNDKFNVTEFEPSCQDFLCKAIPFVFSPWNHVKGIRTKSCKNLFDEDGRGYSIDVIITHQKDPFTRFYRFDNSKNRFPQAGYFKRVRQMG